MVAGANYLRAIAVAVSLVIGALRLRHHYVLGFLAHVLNAPIDEVVRAARLTTAVICALNILVAKATVHTLYLHVLNLCSRRLMLLDTRALAREELLLLRGAAAGDHAVLELVRFGCWALRLCELLRRDTVGLADATGRTRLDLDGVFRSRAWPSTRVGMNHPNLVRRHLLGLDHLLLKVLTVTKLRIFHLVAEA